MKAELPLHRKKRLMYALNSSSVDTLAVSVDAMKVSENYWN